MKKLLLTTAALAWALTLAMAFPAFCDEPDVPEESRYGQGQGYGRGYDRGPGSGWEGGYMMGHGYMHGQGWDMHGRGRMMDYDWKHHGRRWQSMKPEQREKWQKIRSKHQLETLELRQQLATKQMELETLWAQPDVDQKKVEKLSEEVADLQAQLSKKRDKYLLECRKEFDDQDWACPGGW